MTDRQIMEQVRLIYAKRKSQDRMYSVRQLSEEIGLGHAVLYAAIIRKIASGATVKKLKKYLDTGGNAD